MGGFLLGGEGVSGRMGGTGGVGADAGVDLRSLERMAESAGLEPSTGEEWSGELAAEQEEVG